MASLKEQLEAAGYDTSTVDEQAILSKLDAAGYDVSQYQSQQQAPTQVKQESPLLSAAKTAGKMFVEASPDPLSMAYKSNRAVQQAQELADIGGENIAESKWGQRHPISGAALGTAVSMLPDVVMSAIPAGETGRLAKVAQKGVKKVQPLFRSMGKVGEELGTARAETGMAQTEEVLTEPRNRTTILRFMESTKPVREATVKEIIEQLPPEAISRRYDETGRVLDFLNVAKNKPVKQMVSNKTLVELSKFKDKLSAAMKQISPKVGEKMGEVATVAKRNALLKSLGKGATLAGALGGGYAAVKSLLK
jgi:hypothetical protein